MPKRTIKITLKYECVIDDDLEGLPYVKDPSDLVLNGCKAFNGLTEIKNVNLDMKYDRESWNELRRRDRVKRINSR